MAQSSFYITTPIYYVNDVPHLGHAYTSVAADVLARYYRKKIGEKNVFFLTGTDEHGAKIAEAAQKFRLTPQEFVDSQVPKFKKLLEILNISNNQFIRTTDKEHEKVVQDFVFKLKKASYIEKRKYQGLYCIGCEKYLSPEELVDGKCPDHKKEPILQSEENYFFLLSRVAQEKQLLEKIENGKIKISPESRRKEVIGKIRAGLEDVSISREKVDWGIKFPGDNNQTVYVWVDALINYYSATKIYQKGPRWPADLHLIGKDILWFHAVIWPSLLLAIGEEPPREIFAHGYFKVNGQKMSKTIGNVIDPIEVAQKYGADVLRYALLREFPFGEDGDISEEKIKQRYQELASGLGNQVSRVISMINKYNVKINPNSKIYIEILTYDEYMESKRFDLILSLINEHIKLTDRLTEKEKPWELAKSKNNKKLENVLSGLYHRVAQVAEYIYPFMPQTSGKIKKKLTDLDPAPLFPKLDF